MSARWWETRMCAFDVETTSADPEDARIVSATVAWVGGGLETELLEVLINPGVEMADEVVEIHGLSNEHVREHGLDPAVALPGVLSALTAAVRAGFAVVAFNAAFDFTVLDREIRRHCEPNLPAGVPILPGMLVVDPLVCDRHLDKYRAGSRKLIDTCVTLGALLAGAHDSTQDAVAAARLAWVIGKRGRVVRRSPRSEAEGREVRALHEEWARVKDDLPELHAAQKRWRATQMAELEDYFRKGNSAKDVPPQPDRVVPRDWPYIPASAAAVSTPVA